MRWPAPSAATVRSGLKAISITTAWLIPAISQRWRRISMPQHFHRLPPWEDSYPSRLDSECWGSLSARSTPLKGNAQAAAHRIREALTNSAREKAEAIRWHPIKLRAIRFMRSTRPMLLFLLLSLSGVIRSNTSFAGEGTSDGFDPYVFADARQISTAKMLVKFFEDESRLPAFEIRTGDAFAARRAVIRQHILESIGLNPLPQRVPLDIHQSDPLEHPWATVRKVRYQIWPGI